MSYRDQMIKQLQMFQRNSGIFNAIFNGVSKQFELRDQRIAELDDQLSIDTATWALSIYEKELQIETDKNKSYEERRAIIKSLMRGTGKVDTALIKLVADSYSNGDVDVAFDGKIKITFTNIIGTPPNVNDLKIAINKITPAHLEVVYIYLYNLYQELTPFTHSYLTRYTYGNMRASKLT